MRGDAMLGIILPRLTTNHPARVAERVAVLDLLSNGRCEFGMGKSASITKLELFGREVMPEFQNDPAQAAWKRSVMSGEIKLEEIDTEAFTDRYGKLAINVAPVKAAAE
ncbi:LLM class flavin-dependent oxidoreductase [Bradyrhizobium iriomotense]|uniref:LLM class flavin-dependent oxidoreductase n=1 Tax=Bradyrhizobium iriomotense TaxID=441950 RepID=UPI001B8A8129|nr:LLM class flavin-dependent oxidoreductase [Bradyrhizobium iriomotense]MBR1133114.1 LLM class flavin-dependent oxidoreductase [Bradyrhizobium iriomotense]